MKSKRRYLDSPDNPLTSTNRRYTTYYATPQYGFAPQTSQTNTYTSTATDVQKDIAARKPIGTTTAKRVIKTKQQEQQPIIKEPQFNREVQDEVNKAVQTRKVLTPVQRGLDVAEYLPVVGDAISFGRAGAEAVNGNLLGAGLSAGLGLLPGKVPIKKGSSFRNTLKGFNKNAFPQDLEAPLFLSHTMTGSSLARAINENNNRIAAPSIAIIGSTKNKTPSVRYPMLSDDGVYTFYFRPDYIDDLNHRAIPRDMFSPTYANAETYAGKHLSSKDVVATKQRMLNKYGTLTNLQDVIDFNTGNILNSDWLNNILRDERRIPPTLQNAAHSLRNTRRHTGNSYGFGEVMPLDFVDLAQAPLIIGNGSSNPVVRDFLNSRNFYEIGKPVSGNPYNIKGLAFKDGGRIYIKPENRGKFTALKERTGYSASWFKENGTPAQKKMAVFALNARKWKH